jgi:hypothetical protein
MLFASLEPVLRMLGSGRNGDMTHRKAYWATTGFAALAIGAAGLADLLRVPTVMEGLAHFGHARLIMSGITRRSLSGMRRGL